MELHLENDGFLVKNGRLFCNSRYITETQGALLLRPDRDLIASVVAAGGSGGVSVQMELPFANVNQTVTWSTATGTAKLLQDPEQVLPFSLVGYPPR